MVTNIEQYLGPLGLTVGCIAAIGTLSGIVIPIIWLNYKKAITYQMEGLKTDVTCLKIDLKTCHDNHERTNQRFVDLVSENGFIKGKLEVLQTIATMHHVNVSVGQKAEALPDGGASKS